MAFALILCLVFTFSVGFFVAEGESICSVSSSLTCDGCLKVSPDCIWCKDLDLNLQSGPSIASRCANRSQMHEYNCTSWEGLGKGRFVVVEDLPQDGLLQISPQRLKASLRQGETASFNITLSEASTVPLDVYVLMDVSGSTRDDLETLKTISNDTISLLQTFSSDVTIGFGTFADKPTLPFYSDECSRSEPDCVPTYSYRNHLSLTADYGQYLAALNAISALSTSLDGPEGGMDALLQVVVCTEAIGWRPPPVKRLVVHLSDAPLHFAGDGKLGGVVRPHDGNCHLSDDGSYTESLYLDYPSLSMLESKLTEADINVIFMTSTSTSRSRITSTLRLLALFFPNLQSEHVGQNSSNLLSALRQAYDILTASAVLHATHVEGLEVEVHCPRSEEFYFTCPTIENIPGGYYNEIVVSVTLTNVTSIKAGQTSQITLYAGRFGQVGIEVEAVEACNCSQDVDVSSRECSYKGDLVCGSCLCQELRYGERCECYGQERMCPESNGVQCAGHGQCLCGLCACIEGFVGSDCKIIIPTRSEAATPSVSFTSTVETSAGTSQTVTPAPTNDPIPGLEIPQPTQPTRSPRQLLADGISIAVTMVEISIYNLILYFTGGIALGYIVSYCTKKYAWIVRRRKPNARNLNISQLNENKVPMMSNVAYSDFVPSRQPNAMTEVELSLCQGLLTTDSNYKASARMDTSVSSKNAYQLESHSVNVYENVNTPGTYSDSFSVFY